MQNFYKATRPIKIITIIISIVAIVAPIFFAIDQSWREGRRQEQNKVLTYARDALLRAETTSGQIAYGFKLLADAKLADPCSEQSISIMRNIDLRSSYIQAVAHVTNNVINCSSLGIQNSGWNIGPIDWISTRGNAIRTNVKMKFAPDTSFIVLEKNGYAVILNKSLLVDATTAERDASLVCFSQDNLRLFASRGKFDPKWLTGLDNQSETTFLKDGYVIAVAKSKTYRTAILAALPVTYIDRKTRHLLMVLVPIGILAGLVLAWSIYYLINIQLSMPAMIKAALRRNEFFMLYQPVVNLQTGECIGAEALMRWRSKSGEMMPPDQFIQVAEEFGLICNLTHRVVELVSKDAKDLFKEHPGFHLGINLSALDMYSSDTAKLLDALTQATCANQNNLIVEATERGFIQAELAKQMLSKIRKQGISVALDDFGTGYSSLSYLESFEIDYLKIDKSFVDKIGTDAPTSFVVLHIIEMAKELKVQMIAEGVETEAQAKFLKEHGIQFAQGWLFGKPMQLHEVIRLFSKKTIKL